MNPGIYNEFSTAAFRFGHKLIPSVFPRKRTHYKPIKPLPMHKTLFAPYRLVYRGGTDPLLRGIITEPARATTATTISPELTEKFFEMNEDVAVDLASLNIQRGRDHGIPGYRKYRELCGLDGHDLPEKVLRAYDYDTDKVDLWVGVISEPNLPGAEVGPLGNCIISRQFEEIRDGDRFFYERVFSEVELQELRKLHSSGNYMMH